MKILVKYPTRGRVREFLQVLSRTIKHQKTNNVHYLVSIDENDLSMPEDIIEFVESKWDNVTVVRGNSTGKIHACNRDVASYGGEWDILVLLSDDMIVERVGWDEILIEEMNKYYPDGDGVLFHNDGYCEDKLNTMCILGRKYYNRFGYIYHPAYVSLFSDDEFMNVAKELDKQTYFKRVLFRHQHPINTGEKWKFDRTYNVNDRFYETDKKTYEIRKARGFN